MNDGAAVKLAERMAGCELMTTEEVNGVNGGGQNAELVERLRRAGKVALTGLALGGVLGISLLGQAMYILFAE